jgi:hypothetical protein
MPGEFRFRLLAPDPTRKSGFRIVGFIISAAVEPVITDWMTDMPLNADGDGPVDMPYHTAREQGIKIEGIWYYNGDQVVDSCNDTIWDVYIDESGTYMVGYGTVSELYPLVDVICEYSARVIGTIHDEKVE